MRFRVLLTTFILVFSLGFFYSCSEDSTDTPSSDIPEDALEFNSAEEAAQFATASLDGVGQFVMSGTAYLGKTAGDTTYYKDGWWYNVGDFTYGSDTTSWNWTYENKYQFKKNGTVQQDWSDADEMHLIMDIVASFAYSTAGLTYDYNLKYYFDLIYTNLQSDAPKVNGSGYYDYVLSYSGTQGSQKIRYYIKYTFEDLVVPKDDSLYPTGKLTVESRKYKVVIVFDGSNIAKVSVYEGGTLVYGPIDYNLDYEGDYFPQP